MKNPCATPLHHPPFTRQPNTSPTIQYFSNQNSGAFFPTTQHDGFDYFWDYCCTNHTFLQKEENYL